ncbi:uncharacterized protein [Oryctolagus cuniculus]|uniref:uncharacterized protein n=1 Tax=Oryctolagus cuniculus TaxID=9986 RepID=UPI003879790B
MSKLLSRTEREWILEQLAQPQQPPSKRTIGNLMERDQAANDEAGGLFSSGPCERGKEGGTQRILQIHTALRIWDTDRARPDRNDSSQRNHFCQPKEAAYRWTFELWKITKPPEGPTLGCEADSFGKKVHDLLSIQIISPLVSKGGGKKSLVLSPCRLPPACGRRARGWPSRAAPAVPAGNFSRRARSGHCARAQTVGVRRAPLQSQGPRPGDASVSLNSSCAPGKQRPSPPRPAGGGERARAFAPGCAPRRARLGPRAVRRRRRQRGAGRGGAARPSRGRKSEPGRERRRARSRARSRWGGPSSLLRGDEDVLGLFSRSPRLLKTISIVTRSSGSGSQT